MRNTTDTISNSFRHALYPPFSSDMRHQHMALLIEDTNTGIGVLFHIHHSSETQHCTYEKYESTNNETNRVLVGESRWNASDMDHYLMQNLYYIPFCHKNCCHDWAWVNKKNLIEAQGSSLKSTNRIYRVTLSSASPIQTMEHFVAYPWGF